MSAPTLAEMRAKAGPAPRPKASADVTMIEGQHLLDSSKRLLQELVDLEAQGRTVDDGGQPTKPPSKAGAGAKAARERVARIKQIGVEQVALSARLVDFQAVVDLEGIEGGEWQRFKDANPPREGNVEDLRFALGTCSATALFADLGRYVKVWDGQDVLEDEWDEWLAERICYSDRRDLVTEVVMMHEQGLPRAPK